MSTEFLPFATGAGANVEDQTTWASDSTRDLGFSAGTASSSKANKAIRQGSFVASALANWLSNTLGVTVADDGDLAGLITKFTNTIAPLQSFTNSKNNPGYQKLPGGLIIQWGNGTQVGTSGAQAVTFPIAFPTAYLIGFVSNGATSAPAAFHGVGPGTTTGVTIYSASSAGVAAPAGVAFNWLAIGY